MKRSALVLLAVLAALCLPHPSSAAEVCTQGWTIGPSLTVERMRPSGVVLNDLLYIFGGVNAAYTNAGEVYDPWTGSWTSLAPTPDEYATMCAVAVDDKIHLLGGFDGYDETDYHFVYDPAMNTWDATLAALPAPRSGPACGSVDGKIFVAGGADASGEATNSLFIYDVAGDSWTTGATLPATALYANGAMVGDNFYVFGGWSSSATYLYDTAAQTWSTEDAMPSSRLWGASAGFKDRANGLDHILFAGGGNGWTATTSLYEFVGDVWNDRSAYAMPIAQGNSAGGGIYGSLLMCAGGYDSVPLATFQIFNNCMAYLRDDLPELLMPGDDLDLTGLNFDDNTTFWLEDAAKAVYPLTGIVIDSTTQAEGTAPAAPTGQYDLWVANDWGENYAYSLPVQVYGGCYIEETCYEPGDPDPANECRWCNPAESTTDWSDNDGGACDDGQFCNGEDTCNAGVCDVHAGNPCESGETCNEDADTCDGDDDDDDATDDDDDDDATDDDNDDDATDDDDDDDDVADDDDDDDDDNDDGCGC